MAWSVLTGVSWVLAEPYSGLEGILVPPTKLCPVRNEMPMESCSLYPTTHTPQEYLLLYFVEKVSLVSCNFHTSYVTENLFSPSLQSSIEGAMTLVPLRVHRWFSTGSYIPPKAVISQCLLTTLAMLYFIPVP